MPTYYAYDKTILGSSTTVNGKPVDYAFGPGDAGKGHIWRYSGDIFTHILFERADNAINFNGDSNAKDGEPIGKENRVGGPAEQSTMIDGEARSARYDFNFSVTDGTKSYEIAVIDIDVNNTGHVSVLQSIGENGYYLIFVNDVPPPDTDLVFEKITSNELHRLHSELGGRVVCFAEGTLIETREGKVKVEDLRIGSEVFTLDYGYQKIRWIGSQTLTADMLSNHPNLRPIRIHAGTLGVDVPTRELVVSPQHRILAKSKLVKRMFNEEEILVAAKHLLALPGVEVAADMKTVTYWHFLFDKHQVIMSNGVPSESLFTGPEALKSVNADARRKIVTLFPELGTADEAELVRPARLVARGRKGQKFAARTALNSKSVFDT